MKKDLVFLLKLLVFVSISIIIVSCGSTEKETVYVDKDTFEEHKAMEIFKEYAKSAGATTSPTLSNYKAIGIEDINSSNIHEANAIIAGSTEESVNSPIKIQALLFESYILGNSSTIKIIPTPTPSPTATPTITPVPTSSPIIVNAPLASITLTYEREEIEFFLKGKERIQTTLRSSYKDEGYQITDKYGNLLFYSNLVAKEEEIKKLIVTDCNVDTYTTGVYECKYTLTYREQEYTLIRLVIVGDALYNSNNNTISDTNETTNSIFDENIPTTATPTAMPTATPTILADTTKPVITLKGENPLLLEVGAIYPDPGIKAIDNVDGDISSRVKITNGSGITIPAMIVGTFDIIHNVEDSVGNKADEVRRTVIIQDTQPPIFQSPSSVTVNENQKSAVTLSATDYAPVSYSISGGDSGFLTADSTTGVVRFNVAPDYESGRQSYTFIAEATADGKSSSQQVTITIVDVAD